MKLFHQIARMISICGLAAAGGLAVGEPAADYPKKVVHVVVPFTAGGGTDAVARLFVSNLGKQLGQTFIIDNRSGGETVIGTAEVAKAAPDGYTLLITTDTLIANHWMLENRPYDTLKDLAPVSMLTRNEFVLTTNPSVAATNLKDFIALAKRNPGQITVGSASRVRDLTYQKLMNMTGTKLLIVNYRGAGPVALDVVSGVINATLVSPSNVASFINSGKLKAIAITGDKHDPTLPSVPTFTEAGLAGFQPNSWFGLLAPAGTPPGIIAKLNAAVQKAQSDPELLVALAKLGYNPYRTSVAEDDKILRSELDDYGQLIKQVGKTSAQR